MIRALRNRHRRTWLVWAVALPILFILGIVYVPSFHTQKLILTELPTPLPDVISEYDTPLCKANVRTNEKGDLQLELFMKEAVKLPAPVVYLTLKDDENESLQVLLGSGGYKGLYRWPIPTDKIKGIYFKSSLGSYPIVTVDF